MDILPIDIKKNYSEFSLILDFELLFSNHFDQRQCLGTLKFGHKTKEFFRIPLFYTLYDGNYLPISKLA